MCTLELCNIVQDYVEKSKAGVKPTAVLFDTQPEKLKEAFYKCFGERARFPYLCDEQFGKKKKKTESIDYEKLAERFKKYCKKNCPCKLKL